MSGFLVFQLKAPLASFGSSPGLYRATDLRPRRSAILGFLAAALGIERHESERFSDLSRRVLLGHVALNPTSVLVDWHTFQAPGKLVGQTRREQLEAAEPNCIPTRREYLQDGHWLVVLQGPLELLQSCAAALSEPVFPLYLGRKCCVLSAYPAPLVMQKTAGVTAESALSAWADANRVDASLTKVFPLYWEEGMEVSTPAAVRHVRADQRTSLQHNFFAPRVEFEGIQA